MTITDIVTEFGGYYLGSGSDEANVNRLRNTLYQPTVTTTHFDLMPTDATTYRTGGTFMTRVLQSFQKAYTPLDPLTIKPKTVDLFGFKIDLEEIPDVLVASWLGFLARKEQKEGGLDRTEWPFVRWFLEEHVIPKQKEDYEMDEAYFGVYAAPTPGTPGARGTAMNGIKKIIDDAVAASEITPITTGAPDSDDTLFVKQIQAFEDEVDGLWPQYASVKKKLFLNTKLQKRYKRGYRELYGKDQDFAGTEAQIQDSETTIWGLPSMNANPSGGAPSNKWWMTIPGNCINPAKTKGNNEIFEVNKAGSNPRTVQMFTDWHEALAFEVNQVVWVNDQA